MSRNKALMASELIEHLTQLVEQHGDLPVLLGPGHTLETTFVCHRPPLSDFDTTPVIHLG